MSHHGNCAGCSHDDGKDGKVKRLPSCQNCMWMMAGDEDNWEAKA